HSSRLRELQSLSPPSIVPAVCAASSRSTARGSIIPRSRDRRSSSTSCATLFHDPRIHVENGTGNPIFGRFRIEGGKIPFIACRSTRFVVQPESFHLSGRRATNSTSL